MFVNAFAEAGPSDVARKGLRPAWIRLLPVTGPARRRRKNGIGTRRICERRCSRLAAMPFILLTGQGHPPRPARRSRPQRRASPAGILCGARVPGRQRQWPADAARQGTCVPQRPPARLKRLGRLRSPAVPAGRRPRARHRRRNREPLSARDGPQVRRSADRPRSDSQGPIPGLLAPAGPRNRERAGCVSSRTDRPQLRASAQKPRSV
jgi:hypothetical protein